MNYGPTASLRIPAMYRESFTLDFTNGHPVPAKQGVRIFFPLSRFPGRKLVRLQVFGSKQMSPGVMALSQLSDVSLTLVNEAGDAFISNATALRFCDWSNPVAPAPSQSPRRNLLFEPQAVNMRASYAMWTNQFLVPEKKVVLMFTYK